MTHFQLLAIFPVGSATNGVFDNLALAQGAAESHSKEKVLWSPQQVKPTDEPHSYVGHIPKGFKPCEDCLEIIQWLIVPCELNTYWGHT